MIDILITTFNRKEFLKMTIESIFENTKEKFRLFIIDDCSNDGTQEYLRNLEQKKLTEEIVYSQERKGVVEGFNKLWGIALCHDNFWEELPYMCYLQDDCRIIQKESLETLLLSYEELKDEFNIGFFSGYEAPEHPTRKRVRWNGTEIILKDSQSAQNLIATKDFWWSIGKPPNRNPNGSIRGYPNNGRGSQIDLWFTGCMSGSKFARGASSSTSSFLQRKSLLVIPGLIEHLGQNEKDSTWRDGG